MLYKDVTYKCGCSEHGYDTGKHCALHGDGIAKEVIPTPHGDLILLPITPQDMEKMKSSLLDTLSSSSSCHKEDV